MVGWRVSERLMGSGDSGRSSVMIQARPLGSRGGFPGNDVSESDRTLGRSGVRWPDMGTGQDPGKLRDERGPLGKGECSEHGRDGVDIEAVPDEAVAGAAPR